ncbi:TrkA C-terminal domain-containing protein [Gottschalkiaceae bacterium SANA]|nr:TrkA C-terminal domain-containing protein [Gottschalkiaceae bacterium SANA]
MMTKTLKVRYIAIATDIASKIVSGEYQEKEKIRGRSTLASQYGVSTETIRRALRLLEEMKVIEVSSGWGIVIHSKANALAFVEKFRERESIRMLLQEMRKLDETRRNLDARQKELVAKLVDYAERYRSIQVVQPHEIEILPGSHFIDQTISDLRIWQKTGVTVAAVSTRGQMILSPGPNYNFCEEDIIFAVGSREAEEKLVEYIKQKQPIL